MAKFNDLPIIHLQYMVSSINGIFDLYGIDKDSVDAFWECVDIGNKKFNSV